MSEKKMPELLSAEAVEALAKNAEAIKSVITSNDEMTVLRKGQLAADCCCPDLVKFKFVLCNVWIDVYNAACPGSNVVPCAQ